MEAHLDTHLHHRTDIRGQLALPFFAHSLSFAGYVQLASYTLFWLCLLKVQAGAIASARLLPATLYEANASGVPHWLPALVSIVLGASAASLMAIKSAPEQRSAAWVLCLAACAFADRPLMLSGWWAPQLEMGLWLVVPWSVKYIRRGAKESVRFFRTALVGLPVASFLAVAPYSILGREQWHLWPAWVGAGLVYAVMISLSIYAAFTLGKIAISLRAVIATCCCALVLDMVPL